MTERDLLVHRAGLGLGAGDLLWWPPSTYNRAEIAHRLRFIKPATSFRSAYAYDNVLYLVAGQLIEAVSGQRWEEFVTERILKKAGMTGSNVLHSAASAGGNVAATHGRVDGQVRPIAPFLSDNTNPAGGINSSAEDMAKWMNVLLAGGALPNGSRLLSDGTVRQLTIIVTPLSPARNLTPELAPQRHYFAGYALGLNIRDYRGARMWTHTGGLPGYVSRVMMLPDAKLGVTVLTNQESGEACDAIAYRIVDHYLGASPHDWIEAYRSVMTRSEAMMAEREKKAASARDTASKPSLVGDLEHWQHDTFVVRWRDRELRADAFVTFALNPDGSVDQAKMRAVSDATDFSFDFQDLLLRPKKPGV